MNKRLPTFLLDDTHQNSLNYGELAKDPVLQFAWHRLCYYKLAQRSIKNLIREIIHIDLEEKSGHMQRIK
jgi:hypothetical protein